MIQWLDVQAYTASRLAGRQKSAELLKQLVADEHEPGIAAKACLVLSEQYYGQYGCLARLEANAAIPPKLHEQLAKIKIARAAWNVRLKQRLRGYPMLAFEMSPFSDNITGVREELLMLVDDPDPELKKLACSILRQNYPTRRRHASDDRVRRGRQQGPNTSPSVPPLNSCLDAAWTQNGSCRSFRCI